MYTHLQSQRNFVLFGIDEQVTNQKTFCMNSSSMSVGIHLAR